MLATIQLQCGVRKDPEAISGVIDSDLLEIVRDRLSDFQNGSYPSYETAQALYHVENALMWLNRRVEDRVTRGVLGTETK